MARSPLVSIIVPTFNSIETLPRCLESIRRQNYLHIETIVVDKMSRDGSQDVARRYGFSVYEINATERSEQKNYGVRVSEGDYVYLVDSDFVLDIGVVKEAVELCEDQGYDAVCVHNSSDPSFGYWSKVRNLEREMYKDDNLNVGARFVRRGIYITMGGMDPELVAGEDYDFQNRLSRNGYRIGRTRSGEVHIGEPRSLTEVVRKHYYYGKTIMPFLTKNRKKGISQLTPVRPAFFRHWRDFASNPGLFLGFGIYQLVRYTSALTGVFARLVLG